MKKLLLMTLTMGLTIISCEDRHCPAFPVELQDYYPYSTGDLLRFTNHNGDILEFKVANTYLTDSYSFSRKYKCACETAYMRFETEMENTYSLEVYSVIFVPDSGNAFLECTFYSPGRAGRAGGSDSFYFDIPLHYYSPPDETYDKIIIMEKEDYNRIDKVKIIKGKGIVEFWDKEQNCNWIKIEDNVSD